MTTLPEKVLKDVKNVNEVTYGFDLDYIASRDPVEKLEESMIKLSSLFENLKTEKPKKM